MSAAIRLLVADVAAVALVAALAKVDGSSCLTVGGSSESDSARTRCGCRCFRRLLLAAGDSPGPGSGGTADFADLAAFLDMANTIGSVYNHPLAPNTSMTFTPPALASPENGKSHYQQHTR